MIKYTMLMTLVILLSSCQKTSEVKNIENLPIPATPQMYLQDSDYLEMVRIDQFVQKEIINGHFKSYQAFLDKELPSKISYCNILATNDLQGDLLKFVQAKCERSKHFKQLITKYPSYLRMSVADKVNLKQNALEILEKGIKADEALEIFKNRKTESNES